MSDESNVKPCAAVDRQRRSLVQGGAALALAASGLGKVAAQTAQPIRIGYVTPQTGPLAAFGAADRFVVDGIKAVLRAGLTVGGKNRPVEILVKDSQSKPNRAGEVAAELILKNNVDLMLAASTPETTNPVADQCELNGVPCITTVAPWQPWFFTRGGKPERGFEWTYHFFWGLEDIIAVFTNLWKGVATNQRVGGLYPNDGDGNAWGDPKLGFPPVLGSKGFKIVDPGRYQNLQTDFSAQISAFKRAKVEIVTGVPIPPDFKTFWTQARQQGLRPKIASVGKALLFPAAVEALGDAGNGLTTEVWWSPSHPFKSSLTGASSAQFAAAYESSTKQQWTQPLGLVHALFEIAIDVLKRSRDLSNKQAIRDAIAATRLDTMAGNIAWGRGPVKNVAKTPLIGGQWVKGQRYKYDLVIVNNETAPSIPTQAKLQPLSL
jgi:branched-chain amino acid transport system substrate-binding protein